MLASRSPPPPSAPPSLLPFPNPPSIFTRRWRMKGSFAPSLHAVSAWATRASPGRRQKRLRGSKKDGSVKQPPGENSQDAFVLLKESDGGRRANV